MLDIVSVFPLCSRKRGEIIENRRGREINISISLGIFCASIILSAHPRLVLVFSLTWDNLSRGYLHKRIMQHGCSPSFAQVGVAIVLSIRIVEVGRKEVRDERSRAKKEEMYRKLDKDTQSKLGAPWKI